MTFSSVTTGPCACHTICITEDGKCYTFGRNELGQLGHGDKMNRGSPTLVKTLENVRVTKAVAGKTHTLFLTSGGEVWVCGSNKFGELGQGRTCDSEDKPKQITSLGSKVVDVGAGEEFSMLVTDDGSVFSFGHPEVGALGHGTDGKFIISTGREGFREVSTPTKIVQWHLSDIKGKDYLGNIVEPPTVKRVYCGKKHTLALDEEGGLWSWGTNGYGRLGLNDPHDRKRPCKVEFFTGPRAIKDANLVVAGGSTSGAVDGIGQLYTWGQIKKMGESQVRPWPEQNLSGWRIRSMSFGNESFGISADANKEPRRPWTEGCESVPHVIMWGNAKYGELGFGAGKKSSANPDTVKTLTGVMCKSVSCGMGHTTFLLDKDADTKDMKSYNPPEDKPPAAAGKGGKRPASGGKGGAAEKKPKKKK
eukprot:Tamp_10674.p1 GENE.Tamp_10674~~Tamp_10674.p1  ORF type:complete len:469 (-),score=104.08 Tamp_10674:604-1863(-)